MSGTENSMQELFARAASLLIGNEVDVAGDHDARDILQALEYASESGNRKDPHGYSNWPRPMRPVCSALARNSIQHLPIPCMTEARWSVYPASV